MRDVLVVERLTRHFGGLAALRDVSFEAAPGRITAVIGPNGAGKTTAFNCITGLDRPDAGSVRLGGVRLDRRPAHAVAGLGVARTFQTLQVFTTLTVFENALVAAEQSGKGAPRERAAACLDAVRLGPLAGRPARALGFGEQRRLEVARALALAPRLLLLDEPASGLTRAEVADLSLLVSRLRDEGLTVLLIEHDVATVMAIADHVVVLDKGEVIAAGPPDAVRRDPRVIEAYLGGGEASAGGASREAAEAADVLVSGGGAALSVRGLSAGHGDLSVLEGVDLDVPERALTAVVGANGAGKSTLLAAAAGLLPRARGDVRLGGQPVGRLPAEARAAAGLRLVPERRQLFDRLTVDEHLLVGAYATVGGLVGTAAARRRLAARIAAVRRLFPRLAERPDQLGGTLSGGEQQMLAIARGLMGAPRCLMLDEPSLGLAPLVAAEILGVLRGLATGGLPVLLVEQKARAALGVADRAAVLERGRVALTGSAAEVAADPRVRAAYMGGSGAVTP